MNDLARRVVTRSKGRVVGHFYSHKNGKHLQWESQLERDCMRVLDILPDVEGFSEQPFALPYDFNGVEKTYYPDLLVTKAEAETVIEVKPYAKSIIPEAVERFRHIECALHELGVSFEVWTEKEIRREPRWSNVILLMATCRRPRDMLSYDDLKAIFASEASLTVGELSLRLKSREARGQALSFVSAGFLGVDLELPIKQDSQVWLLDRGAGL
ncbi:TnsA endonuclease N-terminal domain-containing protein [Thalassospira xiamenensis]|uniref:TnsA endonuclease N terminal n=1 Tax=Thalassospira xiamenensis TaxID=220697 RepID=A0A285TIA2_9PROT|nr:TnsA endonuclease N-terminal domain-containing protein [Thalassospira xiamenensis]SOC20426.1 TnsA endonuclease N terminal [Thalassospira xiamenensis]